MPVPTKQPITNLVLDEALRRRIEDFRFAERFENRSEAVRYLIEWALNIRDSGTEAMDHFRPERPSR